MQRADSRIPDRWMTHPSWWLVRGVEWPGGDMAEGAVAYAPDLARRFRTAGAPDGMSRGLDTVLLLGAKFAAVKHVKVVFFAELTRWLKVEHGVTWEDLAVDWVAVLDELDARLPVALYLTISQRAHAFICDAAIRLTFHYPGGRTELASEGERERVRQAVYRMLAADWPGYIREQVARGVLPASASG
jgi:hypothetical protein